VALSSTFSDYILHGDIQAKSRSTLDLTVFFATTYRKCGGNFRLGER
jgi:hypothetical protein